ncbi:YjgN family protein [Thioalkalivibrio sulfidiphilus]|uniref:YjgN family protein n=1 Tax=Thioalkalivibrio sulfidiphilus TaxID=1033854 RepID=UPI003B31DF1D
MSSADVTLEFRGEYQDGLDPQTVLKRLGNVFGLGQPGLSEALNRPVTVLREQLSVEEAERYRAALQALGITLHVVPAAAGVTAPPAAPAVVSQGPDDTATRTRVWNQMARTLPFQFSGQGAEFFRIWIVNILLTILTLGIYSAWAKVRTHRYFYGNTEVDGTRFEYLASPISILKGRLIAMAALLLWVFSDIISPWLSIALVLIFIPLLPWVIMQSMAFRNHNSAYRNLRFTFRGGYGGALKAFILWPLLGVLTLGIMMPYAIYRQQRYLIEHSGFGTATFRFSAGAGDYFWVAFLAVALLMGGVTVASILGVVFAPLMVLGMIVVYLLVFAFWQVRTVNLRFNHSSLPGVHFESRYETRSYAWLVFTNLLGMALTLGLFYPWARVRTARYAAEHIVVVSDTDMQAFIAAEQGKVASTGQEMGDFFNVDFVS